MTWYLAPSLGVLRSEVNTRWPGRDKTTDGTVGDPRHEASGSPENGGSDHNVNSRGSVNAFDMDKDGVDVRAVIRAFELHPSAHYWIYDRQIADRDSGWQPRRYTGDNPHTAHAHFSIRQTAAAEQDLQPWGLLEDDMPLSDADVAKIWSAKFGSATARVTAAQMLAEARRDAAAAVATSNALQQKVAALAVAVAGVDEETAVALRTEFEEIDAALQAVPALTVEALGDLDTPEEIAERLRAALGDRSAAVGAILVAG